jgi:hypothetical protein
VTCDMSVHGIGYSAAAARTWSRVCRSSPFFLAFQKGLVQDIDLAGAIFAFTDAIPGAVVGRAVQDLDLAAGSLVSSVKLTVFPGISGSVVTRCTASGVPLSLLCRSSLHCAFACGQPASICLAVASPFCIHLWEWRDWRGACQLFFMSLSSCRIWPYAEACGREHGSAGQQHLPLS